MITKTIKITVAAILTAALIVSGSILIPYTGDVAIAADEYSADQIVGRVAFYSTFWPFTLSENCAPRTLAACEHIVMRVKNISK